MSRIFNSKRKRGALGVVALLAIAAVAFAYWTSSGSGTGSGSVASGQSVDLHGTVDNALVPGGSSPVTLKADRTGTTRKIGAISGTVSVDSASALAGCSASDFHFTGPSGDQTVSAGTGQQTLTAGSISMDNSTTTNQDACKSATLSISLSAAAPATP